MKKHFKVKRERIEEQRKQSQKATFGSKLTSASLNQKQSGQALYPKPKGGQEKPHTQPLNTDIAQQNLAKSTANIQRRINSEDSQPRSVEIPNAPNKRKEHAPNSEAAQHVSEGQLQRLARCTSMVQPQLSTETQDKEDGQQTNVLRTHVEDATEEAQPYKRSKIAPKLSSMRVSQWIQASGEENEEHEVEDEGINNGGQENDNDKLHAQNDIEDEVDQNRNIAHDMAETDCIDTSEGILFAVHIIIILQITHTHTIYIFRSNFILIIYSL